MAALCGLISLPAFARLGSVDQIELLVAAATAGAALAIDMIAELPGGGDRR